MTEQQLPLESLVQLYLMANSGALLPGMVHNLQNHVHTLQIQVELCQQMHSSSAGLSAEKTQKALSRMERSSHELAVFCRQAESRAYYTALEDNLLDLRQFCTWQKDFWMNNLFYKHHVLLELDLSNCNGYTLLLPPYALTLCLEEGLKNALEACQAQDPQGSFQIQLQLERTSQEIIMELTSPTALGTELDPWQPGASSKHNRPGLGLNLVEFICKKHSWHCSLDAHQDHTCYKLYIPR